MEEKKIRFRDLSAPLRTAVAISYAIGGLWSLAFLIGLIEGIMGV